MLDDLVAPDWPPIGDVEASDVLARYVGTVRARSATIWRSPRPMSAAALVAIAGRTLFVKRHHIRVRSRQRLELEHDFAHHLRSRGIDTPMILATSDGSSVVAHGDYLYEVHEVAADVDLYRDVPSWHPFLHRGHAKAAGAALAQFHAAAADFNVGPWPFDVLVDSSSITLAADPPDAYRRLVTTRTGLRRATAPYDVVGDFESVLREPLETAAARLADVATQWTHGDWHGSNLTWRDPTPDAGVASVIDLGLSNRTFAMHDLAIAIERSIIDWLDTAGVGTASVDYVALGALLDGYATVRALTEVDLATLCAVLPVAHVEFALSEVEYFGAVVNSRANVYLAYRSYLLGHVQWFASPDGVALLARLRAGADLGTRSTRPPIDTVGRGQTEVSQAATSRVVE